MSKLLEGLIKTKAVFGFLFKHPGLVRRLNAFVYKGYLLEVGWIASAIGKRPVTREGEPIPWLTYPLIEFLNERLNASLTLFEYGGGNSTLYFAKRVARVITVEHNLKWVEHLRANAPENCTIHHRELVYGGDYSRTCVVLGERYDIVVVDGRDRVNSARHAVSALTAGGVIIFDNFDRERYQEAQGFLKEAGFRQFNFWGITPGQMERSNSALFYRPGNVLGL